MLQQTTPTSKIFASRTTAQPPVTIEAQYISRTVGPTLAKALAEIVLRRPTDPVEYLAGYLYKEVENRKELTRERNEAVLVERLRVEKQLEEQRQEEMRRETEELKVLEEERRKEREAEERRRKELEELAKRKEEVANAAPPLPSLAEEDDELVEFGNTKLHQQAAVDGASLAALLRENNGSVATRNAEFKTPRDIALDNGLVDNVKQIDEFIAELVVQEKYKQLTDLIVLGFDDLIGIIVAKLGTAEQMTEKSMVEQAAQIFDVLPTVQAKLKLLRANVGANDLDALRVNLDRKQLANYRDAQGKSLLHVSIDGLHFEMAMHLLRSYPHLAKLNDCTEKYPLEYVNELSPAQLESLSEKEMICYSELNEALNKMRDNS